MSKQDPATGECAMLRLLRNLINTVAWPCAAVILVALGFRPVGGRRGRA
jgi:hypothetical protein